MPGPFPGMDPYLEQATLWPSFQRHLVASLFQHLLPTLVENYRLHVGMREYIAETPLFTSVLREPMTEEFLEVHARSDGRLVTLVEVVSIANRTTLQGRSAYQEARSNALCQRVNVVELDLLTQGDTPTAEARADLAGRDYLMSVARTNAPGRLEVYAITVDERLPRMRFPLTPTERDPVIDMQQVFEKAYDRGDFSACINYSEPLAPEVQFSNESRQWVEGVASIDGLIK